ncbi:MAG: hypothetical protein HYT40_01890, partial [Candidatus Sungbacteria bacterium]|nr:hypothetical protein [Candidatus Sungbacteria bacterium]
GTTQSVSFSASGLPTGASASFSPTSCNPTCTSTLTIATASTTPAGPYTITVTGSPLGKTAAFTLTVTATPPSPQCSDGIDNDGDTKIDFPADPGCTDATDNDETDSPPPPPPTGPSAALSTVASGDLVGVMSAPTFETTFNKGRGGNVTSWYDLKNDASKTTQLAHALGMLEWTYNWSGGYASNGNTVANITVLEKTAARVKISAAASVNTLPFNIFYTLYPSGRIAEEYKLTNTSAANVAFTQTNFRLVSAIKDTTGLGGSADNNPTLSYSPAPKYNIDTWFQLKGVPPTTFPFSAIRHFIDGSNFQYDTLYKYLPGGTLGYRDSNGFTLPVGATDRVIWYTTLSPDAAVLGAEPSVDSYEDDFRSPATLSFEVGTRKTTDPGDANNDGFIESEAAYAMSAAADAVKFSIDGLTAIRHAPVFKVSNFTALGAIIKKDGVTLNYGTRYVAAKSDASTMIVQYLGDVSTAATFEFSSGPAFDVTQPQISGVAANDINTDRATIVWTTDEPTDSQVEYGGTANYGLSTPLGLALVKDHSIKLSNLNPSTLYHYRVRSRDAAGNITISSDFTFVTPATPDVTPPVITSGPTVSQIHQSGATISWNTDELATTQLDYGLTTNYGSKYLDPTLVNIHTVPLIGLQPITTYHFRVTSKDSAGNAVSSIDRTFTTTPIDTIAPASVTNLGVVAAGATSIQLQWTAPGDDGNIGQATNYDLRYSFSPITEANFTSANTFPIPAPQSAGAIEKIGVTGLQPLTTYYFALKTKDEVGNTSAISNLAQGTTIASTLDRYGGDTRLKSPTGINSGVTFFGTVSSVTANILTATAAVFPTDGRLVGKLVNPNYLRNVGTVPPDKWYRIVSNTATTLNTDPADGDMTGAARAGDSLWVTGVFQLEKIGNRWWFIDPEGNAFFPRAVSLTNNQDTYGNPYPYKAIYLEHGAGNFTSNLALQAENSFESDVVGGDGTTLKQTGDVIYIGFDKPFGTSYFYANQLGNGGKILWYYSSSDITNPWKLTNGNGNPASASVLNVDGTYSLDIGNYLGPQPDGQLAFGNLKANNIKWWKIKWDYQGGDNTLFPVDFSTRMLPNDLTPRYYVKGIVAVPYVTPPVLAQVYNLPAVTDVVMEKYTKAGTHPEINWVKAVNERFRKWGFNAAGQYSYRYDGYSHALPLERIPKEPTNQLSGRLVDHRYGTDWVKNVYDGAACPPGGSLIYQGQQPDVFDPLYKPGIEESVRVANIRTNAWNFAMVPEEADELYGMNKKTHEHMGYITMSQNPYRKTGKDRFDYPITFSDPRLFAKYAIRDFLRYRYKDPADQLSPLTVNSAIPAYTYSQIPTGYELAALQNLNAAWGTAYTTWGTSSGDLLLGTNAYGTGTGFMDENGKGIYPGICKISFNDYVKPGYPKVKEDLDRFVAFFAEKYGSVVGPAVRAKTSNLLAFPLYNAPDFVLGAIGIYTDLLWGSAPDVTNAKRAYDAIQKPILNADYADASHDSPLDFGGQITAITYSPATGRTSITWSGRPYKFRLSWRVEFPDSSCVSPYPYPLPAKIAWNSIEVVGNYTTCISVGQRIRVQSGNPESPLFSETQAARAQNLQNQMNLFTSAKGADGNYFVAGWEHWSLYDNPLMHGTEHWNFGLLTALDNAYDGVEARRAVGKDQNGRWIGGEDDDYGNLLGPLSTYLQSLYDKLIYQQ